MGDTPVKNNVAAHKHASKPEYCIGFASKQRPLSTDFDLPLTHVKTLRTNANIVDLNLFVSRDNWSHA